MTNLLGHVAYQQHDYVLAETRYKEALVLYHEYTSPDHTAGCLEGYAAVLCAQGRYTPAIRLCAASAHLREEAGTPLPSAEKESFEHTVGKAQEAMPPAVFKQEWQAGTSYENDQAIDYALSLGINDQHV